MAAVGPHWCPVSLTSYAKIRSPSAISIALIPLSSLPARSLRLVPRAVGGRGVRQTGRREAIAAGAGIGLAALSGAVAVSVAVAAMAAAGNRQAALQATREGMQLFVQGDVTGSLEKFEKALELDPSQRPYLWQRGLSLYYANRYEEGVKQFRDDVAVNPNDTEEAIWCFLCEAKLSSAQEARARFLEVGRDSRAVMGAAYELFKVGGSTQTLEAAANRDPGGHDGFYGNLYLGLFYEAEGNEEKAREYVQRAVNTPYGSRSGDYMAKLAQVHCICRGWNSQLL